MDAGEVVRLRELLAKATQGEWKADFDRGWITAENGAAELYETASGWHPPQQDEVDANCELVAAAVNALPALLAQSAADRAAIETARGDGWRPIETWEGQPTGEAHPVLLCVSDGGAHPPVVGEAWYRPGDDADDWQAGWWWAQTGPGDYHSSSVADGSHGKPTHWQPMPEPPAAPSAQPGESA